MVALFPAFNVVLVQVLVGQSQRAEAVASVLLLGRDGSGCFQEHWGGTGGGSTHVEVRGRHLLQLLTGRVESFKDDGVCSFTVQAEVAFGAADWTRGGGEEP